MDAARSFGPLRVLVICYEFPPVGGGGGRICASVAQGLAKRGHEVLVLTSHVPGLEREELLGTARIRRLPAGRARQDRCTVPEMASYVAMQALPAMIEARKFKPDVVHAHFAVPSGAVAWLASRACGAPLVVTAHLGDVPGGVPEQTDRLFRLVKPLTIPIWRGAAATSAVASHVAALANLAYGVHPRVILNGIAMDRDAGRKDPGAQLKMIWCGRLQEQKNLGWGIEALAPLKGLNWSLDIIGDGPLRNQAVERTRQSGLDSHITFHGWLPAESVLAKMDRADVLFLPSRSEGLSLVTVEALRSGLAFATSDIPGVTDVVRDGRNGLLFNPSDASSLAAAVDRLLTDRPLVRRMQAESLAMRDDFDEETMIDAYEHLLCSAALKKTS